MDTYIAEVWRSRFFWLSLVKMDLQLRYRRSMLGIGWSLLYPLANTVVLCVAFHEILRISQPVREYVPFLMVGLTWWGYVSGVTIQGCQCFVDAESYIRQHSIPMAVYPLRTALGNMIHFLIALTIVIAMVACLNGVRNGLALATLPFSLVLLLVLGWAVSVLAGYINTAFRDIQHLLNIGFQVLFYLTPIIIPPTDLAQTKLGQVVEYNPLVPFLAIIREPVLNGRVPSLGTFVSATVTTLVIATAALLSLQRLQKRVVLYL
ncbi:MAG TPA: ABC transporter permease [Gemmataceae bacterium]|nr:ABC transporter permease [Gemmataceae bacterium]